MELDHVGLVICVGIVLPLLIGWLTLRLRRRP